MELFVTAGFLKLFLILPDYPCFNTDSLTNVFSPDEYMFIGFDSLSRSVGRNNSLTR